MDINKEKEKKEEERNWVTALITFVLLFFTVCGVTLVSMTPNEPIYDNNSVTVYYTFGDCMYAINNSEQKVTIKVNDTVTELGCTYGNKVQIGVYGDKGDMTIYVNEEPIVIDYIPSYLCN